jgi:hypothetical protein
MLHSRSLESWAAATLFRQHDPMNKIKKNYRDTAESNIELKFTAISPNPSM